MASKVQEVPVTWAQHASYICSRFLAYALPSFFFLVTISFYLKTYDSAQIKITFFQIGGVLLLTAWVLRMLFEGRFPFQKRDLVYVAPFFAFLASGLIAYAHSPFKQWALEETIRRVIYMIIAVITISEMRSTERMTRLWRWLLAAAWVAIGYGVIQYIDSRFFIAPQPGPDKFIWRQAFQARIFSTFGNPNFYGNFLVIITPLIFASILRQKGPLVRPFIILLNTLGIFILLDRVGIGHFAGLTPGPQVVYRMGYGVMAILGAGLIFRFVFNQGTTLSRVLKTAGAIVALVIMAEMISTLLIRESEGSYRLFFLTFAGILMVMFLFNTSWNVGSSSATFFNLILFAMLFLNLYATETKGAWVGFIAAVSVTMFLIVEYFLKLDQIEIRRGVYVPVSFVIMGLYIALFSAMMVAFVFPLFSDQPLQSGMSILWIPVLISGIFALITLLWMYKPPWNLKKIIYTALLFFVITGGAGVLQYAKGRLLSVSFRLFTWIATWEMVQSHPILGNGVGSFKAIYPAFRRPEIIVLEGKSNTETDHAEDEYIEVWQDEGIIGFGIFLWLILTAIVCGLKQLRWYSRARAPSIGKKRKLLETEDDPRSYEVLGLLGAYIGALIHWGVDVSIRFVSSGIFSGLLPGALVAYSRNHSNPIKYEVRQDYDWFIPLSVGIIWTGVFMYLRLELIPLSFNRDGVTTTTDINTWCILTGALFTGLLFVLDRGVKPQKDVPFSEQYPPVRSTLLPFRLVLMVPVIVLAGYGIKVFGNYFNADVHHNLAIFFSKQGIWAKEAEFQGTVTRLPADIRDRYENTGGALEHYGEVIKNNPNFPMAMYFTGNVYNDRGSQKLIEARNALQQGDRSRFERLFQRALELWNKGEEAYERTKSIAPNYVQTHHQMGLLYVKRAEAMMMINNQQKAKEYYQTALDHFRKYNMIDPVFPPNHHRMVQILLQDQKFDEAIALYKQALYHNDQTSRFIRGKPFADRSADIAVSLAKVYYTKASQMAANPFKPVLPEIEEALTYFKYATEMSPEYSEGWKGLGFIYERLGRQPEAQAAYQKAAQLNPNDPELRQHGG